LEKAALRVWRNLLERIDANANVTCYFYDSLHRVTSITYPSGPYSGVTPTKTFVYDTAARYAASPWQT
jgi:YD repeat-containing protein